MTNKVALYCLLSACLTAAACSSSTSPAQATARPAAPAPVENQPAPAAAAEPAAAAPEAVAAAAPAAPAEPPAIPLVDTPDDKLGSAPAGLGLKLGAKAPDATLPDISGKPQRLASIYKTGPTFVVFYRGGWCPFCNLQLHKIAEAMPEFEKKGLKVVAISVDIPGEQAKTQAGQGVPFPMLSDSTLAAHKAFHVVHTPDEEEAKKFVKYNVDLEQYSGQKHHSFAVPSIFLVDRAGKVRWQHVDQDYKTRPSPAQMLAVADHALKK